MAKITRGVKFLFCVLIILPIALATAGIIQTFVIKAKKQELLKAQNALTQAEQEYEKQKDKYDYKNSDEYNDKYLEYEEGYGEDGDIDVEVK